MQRTYRLWTTTENEYLRRNHGVIPIKEMAEKLGRGYEGVRVHIKRMGLSSVNFWKESEDRLMLNLIEKGYNQQKVAYALGRSYNSVRKRMRILRRRK